MTGPPGQLPSGMVAFASAPEPEALSGPPSSSLSGTDTAVALLEDDGALGGRSFLADRVGSGKQGGAAFTGYITDSETSLSYARNRMYSPTLGRFVSRDPQRQQVRYDGDLRYWIGPQPADGYIDGFSLYSGYFVPNDVDPTGWYIPPRTPGDDRPRPPQPPRPPPFIDAGENFYYDTSGFNCLGYATGCKHSLQVKPQKSLSSVMSELGYKCTVGISAKDCPAHCKCSDYVMVYVYVRKEWKENPPKPFGDPWNDPWGNYPPEIFDFHGLKGGPDGYTYQPSHQDKLDLRKWKPTDAAPDYFTAAWQLVTKACCCKPDSMP